MLQSNAIIGGIRMCIFELVERFAAKDGGEDLRSHLGGDNSENFLHTVDTIYCQTFFSGGVNNETEKHIE
ncbi:hypothetical protein Q9L58_000224 [Maublancomyces gigas]|uniref:Uncharacterized protein n=1 Tax=Discina gigas TaxID=1032678 RepID=A0ABR3GXD7_9PEZI